MAERWVDPENGSESNSGLDIDHPWKLMYGQTGASSQPNYTTVAGTIVNVRNGTTITDALISFPNHNFTFRGYGLATNVWEYDVPVPGMPFLLYPMRMVRTEGVNEGRWTLRITNAATATGVFANFNITGSVLEDCHVEMVPYDATTGTHPSTLGIKFGNGNSTTGVAGTVRRCSTSGGYYGLEISNQVIVIDGFGSDNADRSALSFAGKTAWTSGSITATNLSLTNVGVGGNAVTAIWGDGFILDSAGRNASFDTVYAHLHPNSQKSSWLIKDVSTTCKVNNFHCDVSTRQGAGPSFDSTAGTVILKSGYVHMNPDLVGNPVVRLFSDTSPTYAVGTGANVYVSGIVVNAPNGISSFVGWGGSSVATTVDGNVVVENCTVYGLNNSNGSGFSQNGALSCYAAGSTTLGANATYTARNNDFSGLVGGVANLVTMAPATANNAKFTFEKNVFPPDATFRIGATSYADLSAFQAAHSGATSNLSKTKAECDTDAYGRPQSSTGPLYHAGATGTIDTYDNAKIPFWIPRSIGAYEYVEPRASRL